MSKATTKRAAADDYKSDLLKSRILEMELDLRNGLQELLTFTMDEFPVSGNWYRISQDKRTTPTLQTISERCTMLAQKSLAIAAAAEAMIIQTDNLSS